MGKLKIRWLLTNHAGYCNCYWVEVIEDGGTDE